MANTWSLLGRAWLTGTACRLALFAVAAKITLLANQVNSYRHPEIYYPLENLAGISFLVTVADSAFMPTEMYPLALLEAPQWLLAYLLITSVYSTLLGLVWTGVGRAARSAVGVKNGSR